MAEFSGWNGLEKSYRIWIPKRFHEYNNSKRYEAMNMEVLKIFDEHGSQIGTSTRKEAHEKGYWHETFQVYFIDGNQRNRSIYLQKRSHLKKDFPNLFDMTVAGHLMEQETVREGVREIEEEVGIAVKYDELTYLGTFQNIIEIDRMIDKEFSHVYLYECEKPMESFILQPEEVEGIVKVSVKDLISFYTGKCSQMTAEGFIVDKGGKKVSHKQSLTKADFVPHAEDYFQAVANAISDYLSEEC
ncbi:NUDIX hydrolase [Pradoshia eiseniae]|uniref:NUDIX hydrolase n=1 Tax=Pradoshia eiseniae TaxID=2064768 RepID=A0A2S7N103_9BACI|nr:NUDIX domain-containing protein [Pradoshia eiseniae]PQD95714.1 NUDIX hydrolase [Pradoshia eiseniae]